MAISLEDPLVDIGLPYVVLWQLPLKLRNLLFGYALVVVQTTAGYGILVYLS